MVKNMYENIDINISGTKIANNKHRGTTEERPTIGILPGFMYFDTTLGKPIWWNGENWVDATGETV